MRYHDFDLFIDRGADGNIALKSWCDEHGEYFDVATLDPATLAADRELLHDDSVESSELIALGGRLYSYTFASKERSIEWHFGQCWGAIGTGPTGIRVRLRVRAPDLAVIPWEYLYSQRLRSFLGVSERTPIVRYLELPQAIGFLEAPLPVRVLVVIPDEPELDLETERKEILAALQPLKGTVEVKVLDGRVTRERITLALEEQEYHVFHFIGHGDFQQDRAELRLNGEDGEEDWIDHERAAGLFRNHRSLKLVVLNSCRGGTLSDAKPFVGMGAELVRSGIPAVIAMQYEIVDDEAICFAKTLYRQLFTGRDRGRIEIAVSHARNAMAEKFPNTRAMGLPVLFMHAREGVLFNLETGGALRDMPISPRAAERVKAVIRTHERNLEVLKARSTERRGATRGRDATPGDEEAATLERVELQALDRARRKLRFRNITIGLVAALALFLGLGASFFGFVQLPPAARAESYVIAFSDLFHHHEAQQSVMVVSIDSATTRALGTQYRTWRGRHAVVVERLAAAGAPVIAFNLRFDTAASVRAQTESLSVAITRVNALGKTVLAATKIEDNGESAADPLLRPMVRWGTTCVDTARVTAPIMTLASSPGSARLPRVPSLPLAAVAAFRAAEAADGEGGPSTEGRLIREVALDSGIASSKSPECFAGGDLLVRMAVDFAPRHEHREAQNRISYLDVLQGKPLPDLRGRLVLVGVENSGDSFPIVRGFSTESRPALEVAADAINTILRQIRIAPLSNGMQFLVILSMAAIGALGAYHASRLRGLGQVLWLAAGLVLYFAFGAGLYAREHTLLNTLFDLLALGLAFVAVRFTRRTWFP